VRSPHRFDEAPVRKNGRTLLLSVTALLGACGAIETPAPPSTAGDATVTVARDVVYLHSAQIVRTFALRNGAPRTVSVANRVSGGADLPLEGGEFAVALGGGQRLTDADCAVVEWAPETPPRGPAVLRSVFRHDATGLRVEVRYELSSGRNLIRKRLHVTNAGTAPVVIDRIELERFRTSRPAKGFEGSGQPVYTGDLFWGCEYPGADNGVRADGVSLGYLSGVELQPGRALSSRTSIVGAGYGGRVKESFFEYIDGIRKARRRPFLANSSRFDLQPFTEDQALKSIAGFSRKMVTEYRTPYHAFVLDEGWDTANEPWRPDPARFPAGLAPLRAAAQEYGAALGLRLTAGGGFGKDAPAAGASSRDPVRRCLAETAARNLFMERVGARVRDDGVAYLRLDDFVAACSLDAHGHRAGPYAQAVVTDAVLAILAEIRQSRPDLFLLLGDGFWLSPWWLAEADALWRGDGDAGFAGQPREAPRRELFISFVDAVLHRELRKRERQVPLRSISSGGIIQGRLANDLPESLGTVGNRDEHLAAWEHMVVMECARGTRTGDLHLSHSVVTRDQWALLGRWLAWSGEHADILARGAMAGGDPAQGEPYAFVHAANGRAIVAARNPSDVSMDLVLRLDAEPMRFGEKRSLQYKTVYPDADEGVLDATVPWKIRLDPFEIRVVDVH
jgi:hypothetical protein